jgi:hypothetical protein
VRHALLISINILAGKICQWVATKRWFSCITPGHGEAADSRHMPDTVSPYGWQGSANLLIHNTVLSRLLTMSTVFVGVRKKARPVPLGRKTDNRDGAAAAQDIGELGDGVHGR